jgi:hypothetical protein
VAFQNFLSIFTHFHHRSLLIESCAGAKYGLDPVEWIAKTKSSEDVLGAAIDLIKNK